MRSNVEKKESMRAGSREQGAESDRSRYARGAQKNLDVERIREEPRDSFADSMVEEQSVADDPKTVHEHEHVGEQQKRGNQRSGGAEMANL